MKLATAWKRDGTDAASVRQALDDLEGTLGDRPDVVFFHGAQSCDPRGIVALITARWPRVRLHGGSSCLGVMTRRHFEPGPRSFGLLGICDSRGAYGVGSVTLGANPREDVKQALGLALQQAQRPGEIPALVLMTSPPGPEEALLAGISDVLGPNVPVAGGSAGDDAVTGLWWQAENRVVGQALAVVTVLFPSGAVVSSFHSGYEGTGQSGRITRATGRHVHEIDGRPAARVYNEWTGGAVASIVEGGGKIVQKTSALHPLGRQVGASGEVVEFVLSFLDSALEDGTLTLFTEVEVGERLWLMRGTDDSLVERASRVARVSLDRLVHERGRDGVIGALVVFCAACLVYIRERMPEVVARLDATLGTRPYLGTFTFGEQGCFLSGDNRHGNLMVTVILFVDDQDG